MPFTLRIASCEKSFIEACKKQEEEALKRLYEDHYSLLYSICLRYASSKEEAKDWLHDSFVHIFLHIDQYQVGTSLKNWMYRVTVNRCIDHIRYQNRRKNLYHSEFYDNPDFNHSVDALVFEKLEAEEIIRAVQKLSPGYRTIFNLHIIEGYSHKEIADMLGISEATSRSNLTKARYSLRKILEINQNYGK